MNGPTGVRWAFGPKRGSWFWLESEAVAFEAKLDAEGVPHERIAHLRQDQIPIKEDCHRKSEMFYR